MNVWLRNGGKGMDVCGQIIDAVSAVRCGACMSEEEIHALIADALQQAGIDCRHEVRLAPRCRIDFMAGGVGLEIKKNKPQRAALLAQLER